MKLFCKAADGGQGSGVTGYFVVEIKSLFSIVLLYFNKGTREAYHSHAFNALTLWLKGQVIEQDLSGDQRPYAAGELKYTPRSRFHRIMALEPTWALSLRGPWVDYWQEMKRGRLTTLTHGRVEV